jgi:hypothetical protein
MKRLIPAAALVAAALLTTAILSTSGSAQGTGDRTFTLIERVSEASFHFVNEPPRGDRSPFEGGPLSPGTTFSSTRRCGTAPATAWAPLMSPARRP